MNKLSKSDALHHLITLTADGWTIFSVAHSDGQTYRFFIVSAANREHHFAHGSGEAERMEYQRPIDVTASVNALLELPVVERRGVTWAKLPRNGSPAGVVELISFERFRDSSRLYSETL